AVRAGVRARRLRHPRQSPVVRHRRPGIPGGVGVRGGRQPDLHRVHDGEAQAEAGAGPAGADVPLRRSQAVTRWSKLCERVDQGGKIEVYCERPYGEDLIAEITRWGPTDSRGDEVASPAEISERLVACWNAFLDVDTCDIPERIKIKV